MPPKRHEGMPRHPLLELDEFRLRGDHFSLAPLLRGEGGVRGSFFCFSRATRPRTGFPEGAPTSPRKRGEVNQASASIQFKTIML
jgi:hypothetical protein